MKTIVRLFRSFRNVRSLCGRDSSNFSPADVQRVAKAMQSATSAA